VTGSAPSVRQLARGFRWGHPPAVPAGAVAHRPPRAPREFPTRWARTPAARAARAALQVGGLVPLVHAEVRPAVAGAEVLDAVRGPCVLVANHSSHLDSAVLLTALPAEWRRRTAVAAAADYFFDAWWRAAGTALVFGTVPIERRGGAPSRTPGELLAAGWNVVVFPEGTRSVDGRLGRFRSGAAVLALTAGVPLLPVAIRGSYAAMPRGRSWPRPGRPPVRLRFGPPLHPVPGEDAPALTARLRAEVARLLEEDSTDWWSSLHRPASPQPPAGAPAASSWRHAWAASAPPGEPSPRARVWSR